MALLLASSLLDGDQLDRLRRHLSQTLLQTVPEAKARRRQGDQGGHQVTSGLGQTRVTDFVSLAASPAQGVAGVVEEPPAGFGVGGAAPQVDQGRGVPRVQPIAPSHRYQLLLVARRQLRQSSKGPGSQQSQRQVVEQPRAQLPVQ